MRELLHIATVPMDAFVESVLEAQRGNSDYRVVVFDLAVANPNYEELLEQVFTADSVAVW